MELGSVPALRARNQEKSVCVLLKCPIQFAFIRGKSFHLGFFSAFDMGMMCGA